MDVSSHIAHFKQRDSWDFSKIENMDKIELEYPMNSNVIQHITPITCINQQHITPYHMHELTMIVFDTINFPKTKISKIPILLQKWSTSPTLERINFHLFQN
jgi:hypothetical protein